MPRSLLTEASAVYRTDLDGEVKVLGRRNGEYVVVTNNSSTSVEIGGWNLCDAARHCFTFPAGATILPRSRVVIFTGSGVNDGTNFYMNRGRAVWNNKGDVATLWDPMGRAVARYAH